MHIAVCEVQTALKWLGARRSIFLHQFKHSSTVSVWPNPFAAELQFLPCIFIHRGTICLLCPCKCVGSSEGWGAHCPAQLPAEFWQRHHSGWPEAPAASPLGPVWSWCGQGADRGAACARLYAHPCVCECTSL